MLLDFDPVEFDTSAAAKPLTMSMWKILWEGWQWVEIIGRATKDVTRQ